MSVPRPLRLVGIAGTNTEVGKTWVSAALLRSLRTRGLQVAARKPVQSFAPDDSSTDADALAAATGEPVEAVCPVQRRYPIALAPPMAADALGREPIYLRELVDEIRWPAGLDVGFVETVGGVRSPIAHDGDSVDLLRQLGVDDVLLVADAGLGTLNSVRLTLQCLAPLRTTVFLNRYDASRDVHRRNRTWLREHDGLTVLTSVEEFV